MGYFSEKRRSGKALDQKVSVVPADFSDPDEEMVTEQDFRMLQGMYPNRAKELLPYIEEECDRMEYEGSPMFDEYPDYTTIYTLQKRIADTMAGREAGDDREETDACVADEDLIRVMLLQEMHRRRERYRYCTGNLRKRLVQTGLR